MGKEIKRYLCKKGIMDKLSALHMPQQNGVAEHYNQATHEHALAMLHEAKMKLPFWPEAHEYAAYTQNQSLSSTIPDHKTPNDLFHGRRPDVSALRIFGSKCHV
jgi:hypothetical protein